MARMYMAKPKEMQNDLNRKSKDGTGLLGAARTPVGRGGGTCCTCYQASPSPALSLAPPPSKVDWPQSSTQLSTRVLGSHLSLLSYTLILITPVMSLLIPRINNPLFIHFWQEVKNVYTRLISHIHLNKNY